MACRNILLIILSVVLTSCLVQFKMNGASIDYTKTKSVAIADFPNQAALVNPSLSNDLSEGIRNIFERQTRLSVTRRGGDMEIEGEITNYTVTPMAISSDSYASENKLSITIHVRFVDNVNPENSFDKTYTAFQVFDANYMLADVQDGLCETMIKELAENIFNDTVAKW